MVGRCNAIFQLLLRKKCTLEGMHSFQNHYISTSVLDGWNEEMKNWMKKKLEGMKKQKIGRNEKEVMHLHDFQKIFHHFREQEWHPFLSIPCKILLEYFQQFQQRANLNLKIIAFIPCSAVSSRSRPVSPIRFRLFQLANKKQVMFLPHR